MINIHVANYYLVDKHFPNITFKYPEKSFAYYETEYWLNLSKEFNELNLITRSGKLFWQLAHLIAEEKISLEEFKIWHHTGMYNTVEAIPSIEGSKWEHVPTNKEVITICHLSSYGDWPASIPFDILLGGEVEKYKLWTKLERFKGDFQKIKLK